MSGTLKTNEKVRLHSHRWPTPRVLAIYDAPPPLMATLGSLAIYGERPGKRGVSHRWPMAIYGRLLAIYGLVLAINGGGHA